MQNAVWTIDIIHEICMNAAELRIVRVVDAFARESLALTVSIRINGNTVRTFLGRLVTSRAVRDTYEVIMDVSLLPDPRRCF